MIRNINTIEDATREWVSEFNAFPREMIEIVFNKCEWRELTMPTVDDRVYVFGECQSGEIINDTDKEYIIELDNGEEIKINKENYFSEMEVERYYDIFPMWGTMWQFSDPCDIYWLESKDGIAKLSECGFRVYYCDEFGYFFGIDGAGYDFYEQHWIPLYKARGLKWHK